MVLQYLMGKILLRCMNLLCKCANYAQSITIFYLACNQSKILYHFCKHPRANRVCEKMNKKKHYHSHLFVLSNHCLILNTK